MYLILLFLQTNNVTGEPAGRERETGSIPGDP
jgi:hypothetical protein